NLGDAHNEGFDSLQEKLEEKLHLFRNTPIIIYCSDHEKVDDFIHSSGQITDWNRKTFFNWSLKKDASLSISGIFKNKSGCSVKAAFENREIEIHIPFSDDASIENAIHCWCLLLCLGISDNEVQQRMALLQPVAMRLEMKKAINGCSVINDSYSADLQSLAIALDFLGQQKQHAGRTVILSDLLQTGKSPANLYVEISQALQQHAVQRLIGIGETIYTYRHAFDNAGLTQMEFYPSLADYRKNFNPSQFRNEAILVKGARVFHLETISKMLEQQVHQTQLEINLNALVFNLNAFRKKIKPGTRVMAMVKASSYGGGSYEIANALKFHQVDYLAVAYADEGVELRKGGITLPVMVMNTDEEAFESIIQYSLEPEIYSPDLLRSFVTFLDNNGIDQYGVHLEIETGMNRLGFSLTELRDCLPILQKSGLVVKSVFSHLVSSEDPAFDDFTRTQATLFEQACTLLSTHLPYPYIRHLVNSSGVVRHPSLHYDMVRIGIGLYGTGIKGIQLQEVSLLRSTIAQLKQVKAGESVSYGRSGVVHRDSVIATVRIGYADGYPRVLGNGRGRMAIGKQLVPTIGNICMDMTMIDVTGLEGLKEGEDVTVFGGKVPVEQIAEWAGTIPYEILTGISQRVQRVYYEE
ncbi:MAG TPA: alanine racemase, partial [Flavitalea sp.]|nr:alanine racemase [Flavitalea sp.]